MYCTGGGLGDCVHEFLHSRQAFRIKYLVETYGVRIRVLTLCHNDGVMDLFKQNPYIHEHFNEPWRPPTLEDAHKYSNPLDGFWPLTNDFLFLREFGGEVQLNQTELYLSDGEQRMLSKLVGHRPCIVLQPFAGLSDRDAFDQPALLRLFDHLCDLDSKVHIIVIGKNHDRMHKYNREVCPPHPNVTDLIDKVGIRLSYHLVKQCDAFCGSHSNLIRAAWDWRKRNVLVMPTPMMTDHWPKLDPKYSYGARYPETRTVTFPFGEGVPRDFDALDTAYIAAYLLGRTN
jgi:hypothetical protein